MQVCALQAQPNLQHLFQLLPQLWKRLQASNTPQTSLAQHEDTVLDLTGNSPAAKHAQHARHAHSDSNVDLLWMSMALEWGPLCGAASVMHWAAKFWRFSHYRKCCLHGFACCMLPKAAHIHMHAHKQQSPGDLEQRCCIGTQWTIMAEMIQGCMVTRLLSSAVVSARNPSWEYAYKNGMSLCAGCCSHLEQGQCAWCDAKPHCR